MSGMHRLSGKPIDGADHIAQSVADIVSTPIGTRVMRRDYGSRLFELQDMPLTPSTALLYAAATAGAIRKWEPRLTLTHVTMSATGADGGLTANLTGYRNDVPAQTGLSLSIPLN